MDRCPICNMQMKTVLSAIGRTEFQCLQCDKVDPLKPDAMKRTETPLACATKAASARVRVPAPADSIRFEMGNLTQNDVTGKSLLVTRNSVKPH